LFEHGFHSEEKFGSTLVGFPAGRLQSARRAKTFGRARSNRAKRRATVRREICLSVGDGRRSAGHVWLDRRIAFETLREQQIQYHIIKRGLSTTLFCGARRRSLSLKSEFLTGKSKF
jgi:hypothetical protein